MDKNRVAGYVGRLDRRFKQYGDERLAPYGLTNGLYLYLLCVNKNPGSSLVKLKDMLHVDKAYVTRVVARLCDMDYLRKEQRKEDGRSYCLFLTERGEEVLKIIRDVPDSWNRRLESLMGHENYEQLERLLEMAYELSQEEFLPEQG